MKRSHFSPLALNQVKAIEAERDQLADELRKAIAEVERLAHENAELKAERDLFSAEVASESKWAETYNNRVVELEAEVARLKAAQGCEYCGAVGDQAHGEYCRTWEGGDA
jgi:predicted nuclease with TOPRIM domain